MILVFLPCHRRLFLLLCLFRFRHHLRLFRFLLHCFIFICVFLILHICLHLLLICFPCPPSLPHFVPPIPSRFFVFLALFVFFDHFSDVDVAISSSFSLPFLNTQGLFILCDRSDLSARQIKRIDFCWEIARHTCNLPGRPIAPHSPSSF